jgi:molecular chaperone DnaK
MIKDAEAHSADDKKFEELITARNTADGLVHATKKTLKDAGDKVTAEEKTKIEAAITALEEAVKSDERDAIEAKTRELTEASSDLAQKMYAEQQAQAGKGGQEAGAEPEAGKADDDAVDAEFEEVKEENK